MAELAGRDDSQARVYAHGGENVSGKRVLRNHHFVTRIDESAGNKIQHIVGAVAQGQTFNRNV